MDKKFIPSAPIDPEPRPEVYRSSVQNYQTDYYPQNLNPVYNTGPPAFGYPNNYIGENLTPHEHQNHEIEVRQCRLCLETEDEADLDSPDTYHQHKLHPRSTNYRKNRDVLISPCSCKGSMKYVHRACLDRWRALSPKADSFYRCDQCLTPYQFIDMNEKLSPLRYIKYFLYVGLDILIFLVLWQIAVLVCTGVYALIDYTLLSGNTGRWVKFLPSGIMYYLYGNASFFFVLGIFAIFAMLVFCIMSALKKPSHTSYTPTYYRGYESYFFTDWLLIWFILSRPTVHPFCCPIVPIGCFNDNTGCGNCGDCGNCDIGGDSGSGGGILGVLIAAVIIIVVIIIVIGAVFGLIATAFIVIGICQRHYTLLKKKDEVKCYIVKDLFEDRNNKVVITDVL